MKLYVTESDEKFPEIFERYEITDDMDESTNVLVLPGGIGAVRDLFGAMNDCKDILVYNKNNCYTKVFKKIFKSSFVEEESLLNINIVDNYELLLEKLEERNNGKTNNGEVGKLL